MPIFDEKKSEEKLQALRLKEEEDLAKILSEKYHHPYLDLSTISIDATALHMVPESKAREAELAVIQTVGKKLKIAIRNPNSEAAKAIIAELQSKRYEPELFMVSHHSLEHAWELYGDAEEAAPAQAGLVIISQAAVLKTTQNIVSLSTFQRALAPFLQTLEPDDTSRTLEVILGGSLNLDASDIHIEPTESITHLRIRLDGVLHDVISFDSRVYQLLLSRLKLLSGLKLNITERAQDGRFTIRTIEGDIEIRSSMLPGPYGESIVLRILNPKVISLSLEDLGMQKPVYDLMVQQLDRPNGMILTTGPTGSGKTTTLYTFIKRLRSPEINIVTIEDPIEYHVEGANQTQVDTNKGYDFSNGLRSILRQDPDIILVGEIRDLETAEIAMHAALTGHQVFSTLHTNNAPGTIPRLIDLGVRPSIIAPAINVAMAQRLLRKICPNCKIEYVLTPDEINRLIPYIEKTPAPYTKPDLASTQFMKGKGCENCNDTGYKGRIGVFEVFVIDDAMEKLILASPSEADVRETAQKAGMLSMMQDGILKAAAGITTIDEVIRVATD